MKSTAPRTARRHPGHACEVNLPESVQGDAIQLIFRFRDNGDADMCWAGWYIDDVLITEP